MTDRNRVPVDRRRARSNVAPGQDKVDLIAESILRHLLRLTASAHYVPAERQLPRVELAPQGDREYFPSE